MRAFIIALSFVAFVAPKAKATEADEGMILLNTVSYETAQSDVKPRETNPPKEQTNPPHPQPPKPQPQPQPNRPQPEPVKPQPQPQPQPPKPQPHPPKPHPNPNPNPNPNPKPQPNPGPQPNPKPTPRPRPSPVPNPNPRPTPTPTPQPRPPRPQPNPQPQPKPQPRPGHTGPVNPNKPVQHGTPDKVAHHQRPSHTDSPHTRSNTSGARDHENRVKQDHRESYNHVTQHGRDFNNHHRGDIEGRRGRMERYWHNDHYRYYYRPWWRFGFYGGFWYPCRTYIDIYTYFHYPAVYWLWYRDLDQDYYNRWHDGDESYPVDPFQYAGVFYPTDTMRDLAVDVSGMNSRRQWHFRRAMVRFTEELQAQVNSQLSEPITLGENEVVINRYENLQNELVTVEGFVEHGEVAVAFKANLDLVNPDNTEVFVPTTQEPNATDINRVEGMNQKIRALGGDPTVAHEEPETSERLRLQ